VSAQGKNTVIDVLPLVMFMLAFTVFPWKLKYQPPACDEINEEMVVIGQHGFFKDTHDYVLAYKHGELWGKVILWHNSPVKPLMGAVLIKPYIYKNNSGEVVIFPASLTQGVNKYLTCGNYERYVADWWDGVYTSIALVVILLLVGLVSCSSWIRRVLKNVSKK
jgi:hypothetical protein